MSLNFDIELNGPNSLDSFKEISIKIKPDWSNKQIEFKTIEGGLTNSLYACYLKEFGFNNNNTILFRVYGDKTDEFIKRSDEIETMSKLNKLGLASKYYGNFKNGICYEFLSGDILTNVMVYDHEIYPKIAKAIAKLHSVDFNGYVTIEKMPANQEIYIFSLNSKLCNIINENYTSYMTKDDVDSIPSKQELKQEVDFIEAYLTEYARKNKSLVVFSHNDLNPGNLIYNPKEALNEIKFIDFDYSAINYQAFDIANHFIEYCGVFSDYSEYPSREYQLKWLDIYLKEFYGLVNQFYKNDQDKRIELTEEKLFQFYEEVNLFTLTSHLCAVVWCVVQKEVSKIDFDYIGMLKKRYNQYNQIKARLIK